MYSPVTLARRWQVGDATITTIVEDQSGRIPPEAFFPDANTSAALEWCRRGEGVAVAGVYEQSVAPIVEQDADLGDGLRLEPTPGHTPGHVSLWIRSGDETALVSGDFLHHPVQCAEPQWREIGDEDADVARATRRSMLERAATSGALFLGTHFPTVPAGRIRTEGEVWRFVPMG
jgi:glyoxylase-like metal-dependent hydrolase (beta-lactamase superfamily II)